MPNVRKKYEIVRVTSVVISSGNILSQKINYVMIIHRDTQWFGLLYCQISPPPQLVQSAESDSGCFLKKLCIKAFVNIWLVVKRDYLHYQLNQRDSQKYRLHLWKALNFFLNHSNMSFLGEYNTALIILIASVLKDTNHVIFPLWSQICFLFTYINLALRQFKPHVFAFPATALFHEIPMYTNDLLSNTTLISSDMLVGRPKPSTSWLQFPKYAMSTVLTLL